MHDYFALVNSKGGVEGRKIKALEIDHEYKVPPAVESYERHKKEGAVLHGRLRHAPDLRARREADGRQDPRHLAGLRQRRRRRRHPVPVHLPHRRHVLVAGHRGRRLRQEAARRQLEGQEDRVPVLRQPGGPGAHRGARGSGAARGLPAQDVRRAASGRGDGRPGPGHRPALPRGLRALPSVRRRARRIDQGAEAHRLPAAQGDRVRVGLRRGQYRRGRRVRGGRGLLHDAVRGRGHRTTRC